MGKRGRPPQPSTLKLIRGNPGRRPLNDREASPPTSIPACPTWLDSAAKTEWKRLSPQLKAMHLITEQDLGSFAAYCQAYSDLQHAVKDIRKYGRVVTTEKGYVLPHPAVAQRNKAMQLVASLGNLFGLNPSSRSSIKVPQPESIDPLEEMLNEKVS